MIQPWQDRRGASQEELTRPMPGDEAIPGAASTTCAITIDARPEQIWRWRVRIGFDGAGWYRYGRIDDDG